MRILCEKMYMNFLQPGDPESHEEKLLPSQGHPKCFSFFFVFSIVWDSLGTQGGLEFHGIFKFYLSFSNILGPP